MAASDPDFERIELARRALRFLVWHLAAFAGLGLGVVVLSLFRPLSGPRRAGWCSSARRRCSRRTGGRGRAALGERPR